MKVFYRGKRAEREAETVYEQVGPAKFCCAGMCRHWLDLIGFGVPSHQRTTSRDVSLFLAMPQASGNTVTQIVPIAYCPFCGEPVETCRVK